MNHLDKKLEDIANKHLNITTLKTRKSDSLDFYDRSVWGIKDALRAAFVAGYKHACSDLEQTVDGEITWDILDLG